MITELKDGRLWMLIRTNAGFLWESYSSDKGLTWSEGQQSSIITPGSRFFIRRLSSGNLLLVNHATSASRSRLTAMISTDDGITWNNGLLLDERAGISYPDGVEDADGNIWITYDYDRIGSRNPNQYGYIYMAKFREEDVIQGRDVSGQVVLRQVISSLIP
jgi:predicted neuraminidase